MLCANPPPFVWSFFAPPFRVLAVIINEPSFINLDVYLIFICLILFLVVKIITNKVDFVLKRIALACICPFLLI